MYTVDGSPMCLVDGVTYMDVTSLVLDASASSLTLTGENATFLRSVNFSGAVGNLVLTPQAIYTSTGDSMCLVDGVTPMCVGNEIADFSRHYHIDYSLSAITGNLQLMPQAIYTVTGDVMCLVDGSTNVCIGTQSVTFAKVLSLSAAKTNLVLAAESGILSHGRSLTTAVGPLTLVAKNVTFTRAYAYVLQGAVGSLTMQSMDCAYVWSPKGFPNYSTHEMGASSYNTASRRVMG